MSSYASNINKQYVKNASHFVDLSKRFEGSCDSITGIKIAMVSKQFIRKNPGYKTYNDVQKKLCSAQTCKLSDIEIDTTLQRQLDIEHAIDKLENFKAIKVMPIQVYKDPIRPGKYLSWDGQHTAILMHMICVQVFGENPKNVNVPINVYDVNSKADIRDMFIGLNGADKKPLDEIDKFQQMIYGVRVDKSTNPEWILAEQKQQALETHGLFATSAKFGDADEPGAVSRLSEIMKADPDTIKLFGIYWNAISKSRNVEPKEILLMMEWLMLCKKDNVIVDTQYILDVAQMNLDEFEADFSPNGLFWARCSKAYNNWHEKQYAGIANAPVASMQKQPSHGLPFFNAQIEKTLGRKVPAYIANNGFIPATQDLF